MHVSIVVPAYNECRRAPKFLRSLIGYAKGELKDFEMIFVDDGSTDGTKDMLEKLCDDPRLRVISYAVNRGKGHAVKTGMLAAKGDYIIFIDADGSIPASEISSMLARFDGADIVLGQRYVEGANVDQPPLRQLTGWVFNTYVRLLFRLGVPDTLCGFKGFTKASVKKIFPKMRSERWIFDVELLYHARRAKLKMALLPIRWRHTQDTKLKPWDPLKMAWQIAVLRLRVKR